MQIKDLPEINFIETDPDEIINKRIREYEKAHFEATGKRIKLQSGDPRRIFIYSSALREISFRKELNDAFKQNFLAYARKDTLDHKGAYKDTPRLEAEAAVVNQKFVLSEAQEIDRTIPEGTRVSPDRDLFFATKQDHVIPAGDTEIEVEVECLEKGEIGNGFSPGQIDIIVDPQPWFDYTENTETSHGGADEEDDEPYRDRIRLAPEGFSVAGPKEAYEYFARQFSAEIIDVLPVSPNPVEVDVYVLLANGELPAQSFLDELKEYLDDDKLRPLTDQLDTKAPTEKNYDIDITYYIKKEDEGREEEIKNEVEKAVEEYKLWQRSKIGRDINPSELTFMVRNAGAKRVEITSPAFDGVSETEIAVVDQETVTYGGLEE